MCAHTSKQSGQVVHSLLVTLKHAYIEMQVFLILLHIWHLCFCLDRMAWFCKCLVVSFLPPSPLFPCLPISEEMQVLPILQVCSHVYTPLSSCFRLFFVCLSISNRHIQKCRSSQFSYTCDIHAFCSDKWQGLQALVLFWLPCPPHSLCLPISLQMQVTLILQVCLRTHR